MNIKAFLKPNFPEAIRSFFKDDLNIEIKAIDDNPTELDNLIPNNKKDNDNFKSINEAYMIGMIDDSVFNSEIESLHPDDIESNYDGVLVFGLKLNKRENNLLPTRTQIADIARAFNREYPYTPVVVIFRYSDNENEYFAFANTERLAYKQNWREGEKAGKVSVLRDVNINDTHSGHIRILNDLKIKTSGKKPIDSFEKLYKHWQNVFSVSILNKKFYNDLSNWYFWAVKNVKFPAEPTIKQIVEKEGKADDKKLKEAITEHNSKNVIRLLTRLLFTWFIKEKKLIPEELFDLEALQNDILKDINPEHTGLFAQGDYESVYYKAILQNLFFASLNCPIKADKIDTRERGFRGDSYGQHRGVDYLMRYKKYFKNPDSFMELINSKVPFLNGGLFECLDDKHSNLYIDGFSDQMTKGEKLIVPDFLFFGTDENVDLSADYGTKNKAVKNAAVKGLINILKSYKFTITENTPIEEDVALDPELLGKVFENLLASYNPETKTTARKQTGSFYTPREIVNYMVDESLIAYLKNHIVEAGILASSIVDDGIPASSIAEDDTPASSITENDIPTSSAEKDDIPASSNPFLDPSQEINIHEGNLPHWVQENVAYFVTFRLADSIPKEKLEELKRDRERWKKDYQGKDRKDFTLNDWKKYNRLFNDRVEEWMNSGYGKCLLKNKENAKIVADALNHFDGERYQLDEWVIMPNHVHVLVRPFEGYNLSDITHSWKSFTATQINKREGLTGKLWMRESYDHIVRNKEALSAIRNYINRNPEKAGIKVHYQSYQNVPAGIPASGNVPAGIPASEDKTQSKDALETMLRKLISYNDENPFANNKDLNREIISAIDKCKILDPACGSGAFPMGVLHKMVHMLQKLDPDNTVWKEVQKEKIQKETSDAFEIVDKDEREQKLIEINEAFDQGLNAPDYARKLYLIENSIYGVDIQPIATQISKLRFFISLVVDQKVSDADNYGIRPLPNLETRFVTANTLIGIEKPDSQLSMFETEDVKELEKKLKKVRHKLFSARTKETKLKYRKIDKELRNKIAEEFKQIGWASDSAEKLAAWDPYDQNASSPFFDPEWMFDIKNGFDVVIGNPPYVFTRDVKFDGNFKKYIEEEYFSKMVRGKKSKSNQSGKINLFAIFIVKGLFVSKSNGHLTYIIPNNILRTTTYDIIRRFVLENSHIDQIVDLGSGVFENVTASTVVLVLGKKRNSSATRVLTDIRNIETYNFNEKVFDQNQFLDNVSHSFNIYMDEISMKISKAISWNNKKLELLCSDNIEGIVAHKHLIYDLEGDNRFPLIEGKDIKRFSIRKPSNFLLWDTKKIHRTRPDYLWNSAKKIVIQRISGGKKPLVCAVDINKHKTFASTNNIILKNEYNDQYFFLAAIINSDLINWYYANNFSNNSTLTVNISKTYMNHLPIADYSFTVSFISKILHFLSDSKYFNQFFKLVNSVIFQLYFPGHMKERKIDIMDFVEQDLEEVSGNREFEELEEYKKQQIVEELQKRWSNPEIEIQKRINSFKEKSPDVLGVILGDG